MALDHFTVYDMIGKKRKKAIEKKKKEDARKRQKSELKRRVVTPCKQCTEDGIYDAVNNPHGSARSNRCPKHPLTMDEYLERSLGGKFQRYTVKIGLDRVLHPHPGNAVFKEVLARLVDFYREVAIKSKMFAAYHILSKLERQEQIPKEYFGQNFSHACQQLVLDERVTNTSLPRGDAHQLRGSRS